MLKRKMYKRLLEWKQSESAKAFMLFGARQTGKTFLVREFARNEYQDMVEVDFLRDENARELIVGAHNAKEVIERLSLLREKSITKNTLLFFDEIQKAPDVITQVKYLVEDGQFSLVTSGSMLGTELKGFHSFPVGYVQIEDMYPLDFEEFAWALGAPESLLDTVYEAYKQKTPLDEGLHDQLVQLFRDYIVFGGMPQVIQTYLDSNYSLNEVRQQQLSIVRQYKEDISQYATSASSPKIKEVYDRIPSELDKENKRFIFKNLQKYASYGRYEDEVVWLIDAAVALPTYCVSEPKRPLIRTKERSKFKLYDSDTGLLISQFPVASALDVLQGSPSANYGAVYENIVAQELNTFVPCLYYYRNNRKGEVDFLLESPEGNVIPIEVKSGKDYKLHVALNNLLGTDDYEIPYALVLSEANLSSAQRAGKTIWYLPLYMTFCLKRDCEQALDGIRVSPPVFGDAIA